MKLDKGAIILFIVFVCGFFFLFKPWIHSADTVGYFSWIRSAVIDGDINVGNEFTHYKSEFKPAHFNKLHLDTGYTLNQWAIGSAILWSPFFIIAHILSYIASFLGFSVATDGYSAPYVWAVSIGSSLYGFGAILLTYYLCREFFKSHICVLAVMTSWLSTTLVFYMYSHPTMAHANDAFCYALFLFVWYKTRNSQRWSAPVFRGITLGLCALVRQVDAIFVFFVIGEYAIQGIGKWKSTHQVAEVKKAFSAIVIFSLSWWIIYSPQMIVWRIVFGRWVAHPFVFWAHPFNFHPLHAVNFLNVLFSTDRGLFVWEPITIPALIGMKFLWKKDHSLTALVTINFVLFLYLVSSYFFWQGGPGPGHRYFTLMASAYMLGLGALMEKLENYVPFKWLTAVFILFIIWYAITLVRYAVGDIPHWGYVPLDELILGQFTAIPKYFWRIIQIILTRS